MENEMRNSNMRAKKLHCLVVPFPTQGHINPMLQFSKRLQHKGIHITLAPTLFIFNKTMKGRTFTTDDSSSISIHPISDGYDQGGFDSAQDLELYLETFKKVGSRTLGEAIDELKRGGTPVHCIIYDAFMPWVLDDVAKRFGLLGGVFFTQSCAVGNIYYHVNQGVLKVPLERPNDDEIILLPGLPPLQPADFPSFIYDVESYPALLKMVVDQFSNIKGVDWIFCNSKYELEEKEVEWAAKQFPLMTIGPTIPSMYVDKRLENDKAYGLSMFQPETDVCLRWLDERSNGSVVYVSFGSMVEVKDEQMEELAFGLKATGYHYLWVVRASEEAKLPRDFLGEKGLVVTWCPQLEVLSHEAIGCFLTHCGWNSTLEALSSGVAMVGIPVWSDQSTNMKFVSDVWETGLRAQPDNTVVVGRGEVVRCVREVMEGEKSKEIKRNVTKWKEMIIKASVEDGSSDRNINEFIAKLSQS